MVYDHENSPESRCYLIVEYMDGGLLHTKYYKLIENNIDNVYSNMFHITINIVNIKITR